MGRRMPTVIVSVVFVRRRRGRDGGCQGRARRRHPERRATTATSTRRLRLRLRLRRPPSLSCFTLARHALTPTTARSVGVTASPEIVK